MFEQEQNNYWKTVVDTIQDGIMIVDTGGTIISVNRALSEMTGYAKAELTGQPCSVLNCDTCEIARAREGEHWCVLFRTGSMKMRRCTFMRRDRVHVHVLKNASLLYDKNGKVMGAVETMTDISEIVAKDTQIEAFRRELRLEDAFHGILGNSAPMQQIFDLIGNAAHSDAPVIILGESGTGKELVAKAIHDAKGNAARPFVKVNCAALNESLLESELFGHVKGAFTGAYRSREGRFEAARGGDIFLDEIGDLPLSTQVKLLRVLEEKVVERVGDNKPIHTDVRIISATNRNLAELVRQGHFREDLFYRINVIPIHVPPLRERVGDIPLLADFFFRRIQLRSGKEIRGISREAMHLLMECPWPGNVRELKSAFEFAFVSCTGGMIAPHHFPPTVFRDRRPGGGSREGKKERDDAKKEALIRTLEATGGNQSEAARILGVSRVTVWNRMKKYNVRFMQKLDT
ncbi:sigma-54-dependent Fis family transcriptional re gulator [Desulfonema ishimotonii]|uniref:Sigma-54-dependent Fis family transcriptional re gulator n=1 Tax=Desulfonema ishimotonii TaxID=45657 RepID=A0A401G2T4_9BACT|nr:sigma 54-interacting transcriptional regulator [Desulfonema ishimotonii]GBC63493.1 sigma-54-dependent Fis family transcriptional re gulator [Desulfonema ishimotonii]